MSFIRSHPLVNLITRDLKSGSWRLVTKKDLINAVASSFRVSTKRSVLYADSDLAFWIGCSCSNNNQKLLGRQLNSKVTSKDFSKLRNYWNRKYNVTWITWKCLKLPDEAFLVNNINDTSNWEWINIFKGVLKVHFCYWKFNPWFTHYFSRSLTNWVNLRRCHSFW